MKRDAIPEFDARSVFHQNLGMLKVSELATQRHGDIVAVREDDTRRMFILSGADSMRYWKAHQGHFQTESGRIVNNAFISRVLLGNSLEQPSNAGIWDATRRCLAEVNSILDDWAHDALAAAGEAFVAEATDSEVGMDLRAPCRMWAIRTIWPVLFGKSLPDKEVADGLVNVEAFYYAMSTRPAAETAEPESMEEFAVARGFLDRSISSALDAADDGETSVAGMLGIAVPAAVCREERIGFLRPTLGRLLLEKLNIDGLGLLWMLVHLAMEPGLVEGIVEEIGGRDPVGLPEEETPLALSAVREIQRLYPELPFIYRVTSRDVEIGGFVVPARSSVVFPVWLVQRDPRLWDEPGRFDGRRFVESSPVPGAYLPFGVGPRVRSRTAFLQHQLTVTVRLVCSAFELSIPADCPPGNLRPFLRSTLSSRGAVPAVFRRRVAARALHAVE